MKNGEVIRQSIKARALINTDAEGTTQGSAEVVAGDELKVFVRNLTNATRDIIVSTNLTVK